MALTGDVKPGEQPQETFFLLFKFTDQGIRNLRGQSDRVKRANDIVTQAGGTCRYYLTVAGPYDMISVVTGLSDTDLTRLVLALNSLGTVQTTVVKTLHFYAEQYGRFLASLP